MDYPCPLHCYVHLDILILQSGKPAVTPSRKSERISKVEEHASKEVSVPNVIFSFLHVVFTVYDVYFYNFNNALSSKQDVHLLKSLLE